jgi:hypothetical protein
MGGADCGGAGGEWVRSASCIVATCRWTPSGDARAAREPQSIVAGIGSRIASWRRPTSSKSASAAQGGAARAQGEATDGDHVTLDVQGQRGIGLCGAPPSTVGRSSSAATQAPYRPEPQVVSARLSLRGTVGLPERSCLRADPPNRVAEILQPGIEPSGKRVR